MTKQSVLTLAAGALALVAVNTASAGHQISPSPKDKVLVPEEEYRIPGMITLGYQGSEDLHTGFLDTMTPLWTPGNFAVFLAGRYSLSDDDQFVSSTGLAIRYLVPDRDLIIGVNAFYDSIDSASDNHYDQVGLGFEVLSRWVDFRFNYYLPDAHRQVIRQRSVNYSKRTTSVEFEADGFVNQAVRDADRRLQFTTYEDTLEGWNTEIGFLVPGLDEYCEVRIFGGYYHYVNPFGSDYEGFKARLEARILPGLIADVEWWDDANLTGGHWTGGVRASLPFSLGNLFQGRNPFEGASDMFRPRKRDFQERMSEMIIRSHRVKTTTSGEMNTRDKRGSSTKTVALRRAPRNAPPVGSPSSGGGGSQEGSDGGSKGGNRN